MSFNIIYRPLLSIDFIHDYFLNKRETHYLALSVEERKVIDANYDIREWLDIIPSHTTKLLMLNHRMVYRTTSKGIVVYIASQLDGASNYKPLIDLDGTENLNFQLYLKDSLFPNYTNLPEFNNNDEALYFTNINTISSDYPYLSSKITNTIPTVGMNRGGLFSSGNKVYEANVNTNSSNVNDTDLWRKIEPDVSPFNSSNSYGIGEIICDNLKEKYYKVGVNGVNSSLSSNELVASFPINYASTQNIQRTFPKKINYQFQGDPTSVSNMLTVTIHNEVAASPIAQFSFELDDNGNGTIDLNHLPNGLYALNIQTSDQNFVEEIKGYFIEESSEKKVFGVVEIATSPNTSEYELIDSSNFLQEPKFEIHFLNRYTTWKYFNASNQTMLKEERLPLPITKYGYRQVSLDNGNPLPLPNPDARMIRPEEDRIYSEIFVNI